MVAVARYQIRQMTEADIAQVAEIERQSFPTTWPRAAYRRQGIGELLLADTLDLALANRQEVVTLEVRRSNEAAQALYEKFGFLKVGARRRYYSDNHEDAIIMSTPPIRSDALLERLGGGGRRRGGG